MLITHPHTKFRDELWYLFPHAKSSETILVGFQFCPPSKIEFVLLSSLSLCLCLSLSLCYETHIRNSFYVCISKITCRYRESKHFVNKAHKIPQIKQLILSTKTVLIPGFIWRWDCDIQNFLYTNYIFYQHKRLFQEDCLLQQACVFHSMDLFLSPSLIAVYHQVSTLKVLV